MAEDFETHAYDPSRNLFKNEGQQPNFTWNLVGAITQDFSLPKLPFRSGNLMVNARRFTHITSIAIRHMVDFFDILPEEISLSFNECSLAFCDIITMVPEILGRGNNSEAIRSIMIEMNCPSCHKTSETLFNLQKDISYIEQITLHESKCSFCHAKLLPPKFFQDALFSCTPEFRHARAQSISRRELSDLVNQVTHDYKATLGYIEQYSHNPSDPSKHSREIPSVLQTSLKRVLSMLEGLKDAENSCTKMTLCQFSAADIIEELRPLATAKNIKLSLNENVLFPIELDQLVLERTLINLIVNGIEAAKSEASLEVFQSKNRDLIFYISDDGPGISESLENQLFSKGATFGKTEGQGRGLYFAYYGAKIHKGRLHFERRNNKTVFTLHIPATVNSNADSTSHGSKQNAQSKKGAKILVVPPNREVEQNCTQNRNISFLQMSAQEFEQMILHRRDLNLEGIFYLITEDLNILQQGLDANIKAHYINPEMTHEKKDKTIKRILETFAL